MSYILKTKRPSSDMNTVTKPYLEPKCTTEVSKQDITELRGQLVRTLYFESNDLCMLVYSL